MKISDFPQDIEPRVGDILEIEQGDVCFEVRIIGITADGYLCEQDNVQGAVLLEGVDLDHSDVTDITGYIAEEKVRLDPKCWKGKKIGNPKTKMKGGVRVNNCVPEGQEVAEAGPFRSTEPKKPRKGSVADLAAKKRKEQERGKPPIEPRDQMVGVAKVIKDVSEGSDLPPKVIEMIKKIAQSSASPEHKKAAIDALVAKYSKKGVAEGLDELVQIEYWQQETMESGRWVKTKPIPRSTAEKIVNSFDRGEIVDVEQGVAEGLPQTLRKIVPGYAKREIDKKMDAGKFGKTDADKDANYWRYKKIQDKLKEQGVAEGSADTVSFEVDSENAYNHIMKKFRSVIDWDGDTMVAPRKYWDAIQELAYQAGGEATEVGYEQGMREGRYFRTAYGYAGGYNEKTGKKYKHPEDIRADREAKKKTKDQEQAEKKPHPDTLKKQGVQEGYTGRETKDGTWRVFKDGKAVAVAGPFKSREEAAAWIKKQKTDVAEGKEDLHAQLQAINQKLKLMKGGPVGEPNSLAFVEKRKALLKQKEQILSQLKQGVEEGPDKLQGTPVVSLSDFSDKDDKKDKYGRTVPKKLKKDDPRVKFHKDEKKGVAEGVGGWSGPLYDPDLQKGKKKPKLSDVKVKFPKKPEEKKPQPGVQEGAEEHEYSLSMGNRQRPGSDRLDTDSRSRMDAVQAQEHDLKQRTIDILLKRHTNWERGDLELASLPELIDMLRMPATEDMDEAKYQGREVPLGKKMAGDVKKSKVYVRKPNGKVVKVNFGDKNMTIKKSNPARRKSFRARHNCDNPGPRWKARYWSCRSW